MIAFAERCDNLFYLKANKSQMSANTMSKQNKLRLWHHCFGHLNTQSIYQMVKEELVNNLDCSTPCEVEFCEACIGGKQCKKSFEATKTSTTTPLELLHSDISGKMGVRYRGVAEYFLTLLDDKTRYIWIYPHTKDKVCQRFKEWQAEVENSKGWRVRILRTDNGEEYISYALETHLKTCEISNLAQDNNPQDSKAERGCRETQLDATGNYKSYALNSSLPEE